MFYLLLEEEARFWAVNPTPGAHWFGRGLIYFWLSFEFAKASVLKDAAILRSWSPWNSSASTQQAPETTSHLECSGCPWQGWREAALTGTQHLTFVCSHTTVHWGQPYLWSWSCHCWRKITHLKEGMIKGVESTKEQRKSLLVESRRNLTQTNLARKKYLLSHLMRESEVGTKQLQWLREYCHLHLFPSTSLLLFCLPFFMSYLAQIISVGCPQPFLPASGILWRRHKRNAGRSSSRLMLA